MTNRDLVPKLSSRCVHMGARLCELNESASHPIHTYSLKGKKEMDCLYVASG